MKATIKKLCEDFFYKKNVLHYEICENGFIVRLAKVPLADGVAAVYSIETFANGNNPVAFSTSKMDFVCMIAHDKYILLFNRPYWLNHIAIQTNCAKDEYVLMIRRDEAAMDAKLKEAACAIVKSDHENKPVEHHRKELIIDLAMKKFFGRQNQAIYDYREPNVSFRNFDNDTIVSAAQALPDYEKAAEIWLGISDNRERLERNIIFKKESEKLAAEWEADTTSELHAMREINTAIKDKKTVQVTLNNGEAVTRVKISTDAFKTGMICDDTQFLPFGYIDCFAVTPYNTLETLRKEYGWRVPIQAVSEITYRGKTIWERKQPAKAGNS